MNAYEILKLMHPIKSVPKSDVNFQELVKTKFPTEYQNWRLFSFDWNDLDGILDFLYGLQETCHINTTNIINLIESNCEVKYG